ncbi:MAG: nuclear transport factor 2 family protein [Bacteroidota bacterium]
MKNFLICLVLIMSFQVYSQNPEELKVKNTIKEFFKGFHAQDSVLILKTVHTEIKMQSVDSRRGGKAKLDTSKFENFLNSILSIPETVTFNEKLLDYDIKIDGNMAHAWTPYEFYLNGKLSHTGVNSFQLFKDEDDWKIIYIVDTRNKPTPSLPKGG